MAQFLKEEIRRVDFREFTAIEDKAAESLSRHEGNLDLDDLTSLSDAAAESLCKYERDLDLSLDNIPKSAASILRQHPSFAKHVRQVPAMSNEKVLTQEIAKQFFENVNSVDLSEFTAIEDAAAKILSKHEDYLYYLYLPRLKSLSDATAESLSKHKGTLNLDGLTRLAVAAAESLSKYEGELRLSLDKLPESAAAILRQHPSFAKKTNVPLRRPQALLFGRSSRRRPRARHCGAGPKGRLSDETTDQRNHRYPRETPPMNAHSKHNQLTAAITLIATAMLWPMLACAAHGAELDLRPIEQRPETLTSLHPKLKWMTEQKIRMMWIGDELYEKYADTDQTKGQVIVDAGFNLVRISMGVNTSNKPSGVVDTSEPLELKHDRSKSTQLETRLAPNVAEAKRAGIPLMIGWQYGTHHLEPYRKYRTAKGELHKITCCPLDETYIAGQHVGKWAVKLAEGGADGMLIDMEMYHSDTSWFRGPCTCDDCFETYLKRFGRSWRTTYDKVPAESRGTWLADQKATTHYAAFAAKRIERMYDSIRRKCQAINPAFFFGIAPQLNHLPGAWRGLGTRSVPCLAFGEHEYTHGAYRGSFMCTKQCRESLPALYVSGAFIARQPPEMLANNVIQSSLYTNGWWAYYGTALLIKVGPGAEKTALPGGYGRWGQTSAADYWERITAAHTKLDELLKLPKDQWPERQDGKLKLLRRRVAEAKDDKTRAEMQAGLDKYMGYVRQGGY